MRITNKIMQNNSVYNINQNKILQDKLNSQITTRQKVLKPSDDPVTAIRSLRLRSNLNQVSQYYQKNIPDAENWLDLTESSITTTVAIVTDMINEFQRGSKGRRNSTVCWSSPKMKLMPLSSPLIRRPPGFRIRQHSCHTCSTSRI